MRSKLNEYTHIYAHKINNETFFQYSAYMCTFVLIIKNYNPTCIVATLYLHTYDWFHERIDLYSENLPIEVQNKKTSFSALKHLVYLY